MTRFPWLDSQGHAPYAWTVLGAVAQGTDRVELMTYVTCPTLRYHPAVVAQKAATLAVLSDGRFQLDVGAGEILDDHVVGERWPAVGKRHDMLEGDDARDDAVPESRKIGQVPISWDRDRGTAIARAHEQSRWFAGGWKVNADLPTTEAFDAASQFVRPSDVAEQIPWAPDLDAVVEAVAAYWEAGFTDVALVQIGDENQDELLATAAPSPLDKLRAAAPSD